MTEKEKAQKGMLYDANHNEALRAEILFCQGLCYEYNALHPSKIEERERFIKMILGKTGEKFLIEQPFLCDYGYNITIGENFYANHNMIILDCAKVTFGDDVFVSPNCGFYTAGHPLDFQQRNLGLEYAYPITIGNNVWIGANTAVLAGVTIGDNTVIGAGSVVDRSIPSNVLAVGNPCRVIRKITEKDRMPL